MKKKLIGLLILLGGLVLAIALATRAAPAEPQALALLEDLSITRQPGGWLHIHPEKPLGIGFVFYPGGKVKAEAYLPILNLVAESGIDVFLTPMPLNLAVFNPSAARQVLDANPAIQRWVVGGHSLGGVMAADYALKDTRVGALVLWAAYPAETGSLANSNLSVLSVYASQDGLSTPTDIANSAALLPASALFFPIEGGNHAQFGAYGKQDGDGIATITPADQATSVSLATSEFILSNFTP